MPFIISPSRETGMRQIKNKCIYWVSCKTQVQEKEELHLFL